MFGCSLDITVVFRECGGYNCCIQLSISVMLVVHTLVNIPSGIVIFY